MEAATGDGEGEDGPWPRANQSPVVRNFVDRPLSDANYPLINYILIPTPLPHRRPSAPAAPAPFPSPLPSRQPLSGTRPEHPCTRSRRLRSRHPRPPTHIYSRRETLRRVLTKSTY